MKAFLSLFMSLFSLTSLQLEKDLRKHVYIIDTGIDRSYQNSNILCRDDSHKTYFSDIYDNHGHGTKMTLLVMKDIDLTKFCITVIKVYNYTKFMSAPLSWQADMINTRVENVVLFNVSMAGESQDQKEEAAIKSLTSIYYVTAAGNDGVSISRHAKCNTYPACYRVNNTSSYLKVIGATDKQGAIISASNHGDIVTDYMLGEGGTSEAAANYSNSLLRDMK